MMRIANIAGDCVLTRQAGKAQGYAPALLNAYARGTSTTFAIVTRHQASKHGTAHLKLQAQLLVHITLLMPRRAP